MVDDNFVKPQYKMRSASISAPPSSSLEAIINSQCEVDSHDGANGNGTPGYRRRKPATRSQSARIPTGRTVMTTFDQLFHQHFSHFFFF